jgi:hypothetical protein
METMPGYALVVVAFAALWWAAIARNRKQVARLDCSGDPAKGIVIFVEPVRWLFIVWGVTSFAKGLRRAGYGSHLRLFRWSGLAGALLVIPDLVRRERLLVKAHRLARFIDDLAALHPGRAIHLCGYSTGCYLVLEAIKRVRSPDRLASAVLLASTVSPDYRLDTISERVASLHSFHSRADFIVNGLGPLLFGCNDRRHSPAAGMIGFAADRAHAAQHAWTPRDAALGYFGDHFSVVSSRFVASRVAPLIGSNRASDHQTRHIRAC